MENAIKSGAAGGVKYGFRRCVSCVRIKLADNVPLDIAKCIQANYMCARKISERHPERIHATVSIRKGVKMNKTQLYHATLIIKV